MQRTIRLAPLGMLAVAFAVVVTLTVVLGDSSMAIGDDWVPCPTVAPGPTKTPDGPTKTPSPTGTPCKATLTPTDTPRPPTPTPTPIGGVGFFPDVADSSGGNTGVVAALIVAATAGAVGLGGAAWYARRRWRG